jgi:hypothetical protein
MRHLAKAGHPKAFGALLADPFDESLTPTRSPIRRRDGTDG